MLGFEDLRLDLFCRATVVLILGTQLIRGQAPSEEEQRYLRSVLPLIQERKWGDAESKFKEGLSQFPKSALLANALGMVYEQQGREDAAARQFEQALEWLPSFTAARIHLAAIYGKQGNCAKASQLYRAAAEATADAVALTAIGIGLGECQAYADAALVLEKAHGINPASATTTWNMALAEFKAGAFEQVLTSLDALPRGSESLQPEVLYLRGKAVQALKRPGAGLILAQACRAKPRDDYCSDASIFLMREGQLQQAAELLELELRNQQPTAAALSLLGLVQFRLGRYHEAIKSYTQAIQCDAALAAPREGLAFLLYMTGDLDAARATVEDALKGPSVNFYVPYLHALILWRISHRFGPDALTSLAVSLQRNPNFAPAYFLRGKIRADGNDLDAALTDFQRAAALDTKYALPWYKMAQLYRRQGRLDDATAAEHHFAALGSLREEEVLAREAQDVLAPVPH
ncbi:MAG: tetratricopeptide repeat protein [Bryobacteraceae bacterium]